MADKKNINETARLPEIDAAKGFAIILVVFGHVVARQPPAGNEWYEFSKWLIYLFHMPFFMFLAGLVYGLKETVPTGLGEYLSYAQKKITRFIPGYVVIGTAIVLAKSLGGNVFHIDNKPDSLLLGLIDLIILPIQSGAGFLWFIYVLLAIYLLFPLVLRACGMRKLPVFILGALALLLNPPQIFAADRVAYFFFFFGLGYIAGTRYQEFCAFCIRFGHIAIIGFFLAILEAVASHRYNSLYVAVLAIPALYAMTLAFRDAIPNLILEFGKVTFAIYLLNTICIGITKAVGFKFIPWDGGFFLIYFPILLFSGLVVPYLIKKALLPRFSWI